MERMRLTSMQSLMELWSVVTWMERMAKSVNLTHQVEGL